MKETTNPTIVLARSKQAEKKIFRCPRALTSSWVLSLLLAVGPNAGLDRSAFAQQLPEPEDLAAQRAVYDNDELFNQLSGAARTRAELKFGRKGGPGVKPGPVTPAPGAGENKGAGNPHPRTPLVNTTVNDPAEDTTTQDTQSETTLVLGSGSTLVSAFNDSSFYNGTTSFKFTGFAHSSNGGASWVDGGTLPNSSDGDAGDPVLAFSAKTGTYLMATLSFNTFYKLLVFRSVNSGVSFTGPINATPGFTAANGDHDKEWLTVDNFAGPGFGNAYLIWRNFTTNAAIAGMNFTRSTDDGLTWSPAPALVLASGTGQGGQVVVGTDHTVYVFWFDQSVTPARIVMRKSVDFGVSFGGLITVTTLISTGVNGDLGLAGFRTSAFPQVTVNPVSGNLYIIYADVTAISGGDRGNIYFRQSSNGGTTWSAAVKVNDDTGLNAQFQPGIAVRPDGTALGAAWYDRRRDPADSLIERWGAAATISGNTVTFGRNFRISPQFPVVVGVDPVINPTYMGDYDQMAADNDFFYTTWGDNRDASTAAPGRKNANVRFAKFPLEGPGPILDADVVRISGGNGNSLVDPNECNDFQVVIRNNGTGSASNVVATLINNNPGVTLLQSSSAYPDVAAGATATNTLNFKISTGPAFSCGDPIGMTLALAYSGGSDNALFNVPETIPGYAVAQSSGAAIVPGITDIGNHGDDVTTTISLPFPYGFYGQTFSNATLCSNGNLQFETSDNNYLNVCLPVSALNNVICPHWDDLRTDGTVGAAQGIYTSTSGSAPNRIFNIEWRASYYSSTRAGNPLNFEVRLYEAQPRFDLIYGVLNGTGSSATVGAKHGSTVSQFECNSGVLSAGLQLSFQKQSCPDGGGACPVAPPVILNPWRNGPDFIFSFQTTPGLTYIVQCTDSLTITNWQTNQTLVGDGSLKTITNSVQASAQRYYRLFLP